MQNDHLNSVHLETSRREQFRRAREAVLNACGQHTLRYESTAPARGPARGQTIADPPSPPSSPESQNTLTLVGSDHKRHALRIGLNTVGRLPDNDVVVSDPHVSRRHCTIIVHACRTCEVHDTASKNGIYVNGQKVASPVRLCAGDELRMGDLRLMLCTGDGPRMPEDRLGGQTSIVA